MDHPDARWAVAQPLLWLGLGNRGARMAAEVQASAERLSPADAARVRCLSLPGTADASAALLAALPDVLDDLYSVPRGAWGGLDVVLLADLSECQAAAPTAALRALLECLETTRGGLVRTRGASSERGLFCHALFAMPAPSDPRLGAHALEALDTLEGWHRAWGRESPLARVWCWPTRGPLGSLTADDLGAILTELAQAAFLAGTRTDDAVRALLEPPEHDPGRIAIISASALTLPVRRVEQYLEQRLTLLALESLQGTVGKSATSSEPDLLLREVGGERLTGAPAAELPPFKQSPEADAQASLVAVDEWISRRVGVEMGLERALEVEAALEGARGRALAHAAALARLASALDSAPPRSPARALPSATPARTPRWLVAPLAGAVFCAAAALGCALSTPDTLPSYVWVHMAFPGLVAAMISAGAWLAGLGASELRARTGAETAQRVARRESELSERRAESIADEARFARALARGLKGRADACRAAVRALDACVGRVRSQLAALDVAPGSTPEEDRLDRLFPARGSRVALLCSATDIGRLARVPDLSDWRHRALSVALPHTQAGRVQLEEAFTNEARVVALAREQAVMDRVRRESPFDWGRAAASPVGRWLEGETERLVPSHDLGPHSSERGVRRHRLMIGPAAAQQGEAAAFNDARRSGWTWVEATSTHPTLLLVHATTGLLAAQLRPT
jgi:hypothetical protein